MLRGSSIDCLSFDLRGEWSRPSLPTPGPLACFLPSLLAILANISSIANSVLCVWNTGCVLSTRVTWTSRLPHFHTFQKKNIKRSCRYWSLYSKHVPYLDCKVYALRLTHQRALKWVLSSDTNYKTLEFLLLTHWGSAMRNNMSFFFLAVTLWTNHTI